MPGKAAESPPEKVPPAVKPKTEAQQAENRRKIQTFKGKRKAREPLVSQQYRIAKRKLGSSSDLSI
jgi:hypothetical protein